MRKPFLAVLALVALVLAGCVTINVYFPEAAAQRAADQFIGNVLDEAPAATPQPAPAPATKPDSAALLDLLIPAAHAADTPDLRVRTAETEAIRARMRERFQGELGQLFAAGTLGFTRDGMVAVRDPAGVALASRTRVNALVAAENQDRTALYREVARANQHPEWESQIRATFAKGWIERARSGWYYQDPAGAWRRK